MVSVVAQLAITRVLAGVSTVQLTIDVDPRQPATLAQISAMDQKGSVGLRQLTKFVAFRNEMNVRSGRVAVEGIVESHLIAGPRAYRR